MYGVVSDMELLVSNGRTFNGKVSPITVHGEILLSFFKQQIRAIMPNLSLPNLISTPTDLESVDDRPKRTKAKDAKDASAKDSSAKGSSAKDPGAKNVDEFQTLEGHLSPLGTQLIEHDFLYLNVVSRNLARQQQLVSDSQLTSLRDPYTFDAPKVTIKLPTLAHFLASSDEPQAAGSLHTEHQEQHITKQEQETLRPARRQRRDIRRHTRSWRRGEESDTPLAVDYGTRPVETGHVEPRSLRTRRRRATGDGETRPPQAFQSERHTVTRTRRRNRLSEVEMRDSELDKESPSRRRAKRPRLRKDSSSDESEPDADVSDAEASEADASGASEEGSSNGASSDEGNDSDRDGDGSESDVFDAESDSSEERIPARPSKRR